MIDEQAFLRHEQFNETRAWSSFVGSGNLGRQSFSAFQLSRERDKQRFERERSERQNW